MSFILKVSFCFPLSDEPKKNTSIYYCFLSRFTIQNLCRWNWPGSQEVSWGGERPQASQIQALLCPIWGEISSQEKRHTSLKTSICVVQREAIWFRGFPSSLSLLWIRGLKTKWGVHLPHTELATPPMVTQGLTTCVASLIRVINLLWFLWKDCHCKRCKYLITVCPPVTKQPASCAVSWKPCRTNRRKPYVHYNE